MAYSTPFPDLSLSDFGYDLPEDRIARYPLEKRDSAKLLVWKTGCIEEGLIQIFLYSYLLRVCWYLITVVWWKPGFVSETQWGSDRNFLPGTAFHL